MNAKKGVLIVILLLLLASFVCADDEAVNVILTLKDIKTNSDIDSVVVSMHVGDDVINHFVEEDEIFRTSLDPGKYNVKFKVDSLLTEGKDYYGLDIIDVEKNVIKGVYLYPVGSIRGMVKDSLDNIVSNAKLKFECSGAELIDYPDMADEYGSFSIDYMPVCNCKIFASYEEGVGFTDVKIEKGSLNDVEIKLNKSIVEEKSYLWLVIILVVVIFILLFIFKEEIKALTKREKKLEKIEKKEEKEIKDLKVELELGKRATDVMKTLNNKEKDVVNLLISRKNSSTQANIRHNTGIPRTSLSRILNSLETKNIIKVRKEGKAVKIELTDWFLGKE